MKSETMPALPPTVIKQNPGKNRQDRKYLGRSLGYHVAPPPTNFILKRRYLKGVNDAFDGDVEIGEDGMTFNFSSTVAHRF